MARKRYRPDGEDWRADQRLQMARLHPREQQRSSCGLKGDGGVLPHVDGLAQIIRPVRLVQASGLEGIVAKRGCWRACVSCERQCGRGERYIR